MPYHALTIRATNATGAKLPATLQALGPRSYRAGRSLVAEIDGTTVAAISLTSGAVAAPHAPSSCSASPPGTPANSSPPPARTSSDSPANPPSPRRAAPAPSPASSGKTSRHRLNPGGDGDANRALHLIAVVRLRCCQRTRAYAERRTREGKSKREIIRCLKRYIAREVYTTLRGRCSASGSG